MKTFLYTQRRVTLQSVLFLVLVIALLNLPFLHQVRQAHALVTGFVTRSGSQLLLNGSSFRFAGANIYWLGLDEGAQSYPSAFRIEDALTVANEMGLTVVRSHSLGVSTGCALCVEPTLGTFNQTALQHIDAAITAASNHGLRLIIPLTDNYHFYHGGKHNFTDWRGISDENQFYYNQTVIGDFEQYIGVLLNHVNVYTGIAYKNDPTIMAWETGNELLPPSSWTQTIANYIKSVDTNHLVMDGNYGVDPNSLPIPTVDIYSDHFYPPDVNRMNADAAMTGGAGKAFVIGEYDWETTEGSPLSTFLGAILANRNVSGDLFWDIWPHSDTYGYLGGGGINMNYPGDTPDRRSRIQTIRSHAYAMRGLAVPPDSIPGAPLITSIVGQQIAWRGTAVADRYSVERSTTSASGPWTVICDRCATDYDTPWTDSTQPAGPVWYRVRAYNLSGVPGPYSNVYGANGASTPTPTTTPTPIPTLTPAPTPTPTSIPTVTPIPTPPGALVDDLNDWSKVYYHTLNLHFDTSNPQYFNGDPSRAFRWSIQPTPDYIVWRYPGMKSFTATGYFWPNESVSHFSFYVADATMSWTRVIPTITERNGNWLQFTYDLSGFWNVMYLRIQWNNTAGQSWSPQLGQVIIS